MTTTHEQWLDDVLPKHGRLTTTVVSILENLLREQKIDYLAVTGRTKDRQSALDKIQRKGYSDPAQQMTDLSGVRVVVYFESDVERVGKLIEQAFAVDKPNSLDKDSLLQTNQIGYRSVRYVCDLGTKRSTVDEYRSLSSLKFEFQIRTVLQHAWAELAHDRNYKFTGALPREMERKLYLYAGLLEIADRGFDETAREIDQYAESLEARTTKGDLDIEITSISLDAFFTQWAEQNGFPAVDPPGGKAHVGELVRELREFGITELSQLQKIIPPEYIQAARRLSYSSNIFGTVRDWMLIHDWRRFTKEVTFSWILIPRERTPLEECLGEQEYAELASAIGPQKRTKSRKR